MNLKTRLSLLEKGSPEIQPEIIVIHDGRKTPEQLQQIEEAESKGLPVKVINFVVVDSDGSRHEKNGST